MGRLCQCVFYGQMMTRPGCLDCRKFIRQVHGDLAKGVPLGPCITSRRGEMGVASLAENKVCVNIFPPLISSILVSPLVASRRLTRTLLCKKEHFERMLGVHRIVRGLRVRFRGRSQPRWLGKPGLEESPPRLGCEGTARRHLGCEGRGGTLPLGLDVHVERAWGQWPFSGSWATGGRSPSRSGYRESGICKYSLSPEQSPLA